MAESKPTVTLKDGTKITLDDPSQIAQYSNREDLESITFGGEEGALAASMVDAGIELDAGVAQTIALVEQPKADPVVPKPAPASDASTTITVVIGALAGALSSAGTPALTNLAKNFIKNKLKGKKGGDSKEDEPEEPTDCKTHQIKSNAKLAKMSVRITALENKSSSESKLFSGEGNPLEDLEERIENLEKQLKAKGKKK